MNTIRGFKITAQDTRQIDIAVSSIQKIEPGATPSMSKIILKEPLSYLAKNNIDRFNQASDSTQNAVDVRFGFDRLSEMYDYLNREIVRSFDITADTGPIKNNHPHQTKGKTTNMR